MIGGARLPAQSSVEFGTAITVPPLLMRTSAACNDWNLWRACVFSIDRLPRRYYGVHEFSLVGDNLLRISVSIAEQRITFGDGTEILPGDVIIDLHLWNERIPALGSFRCGLGWGSRAKQRIEHSLAVLAAHVEADPSLAQCKAFRAEAVFLTGRQAETLSRIAGRLGFGARIAPRPADPGHTMLAFALAWACQPSAPMPRRLRASRYTCWMSRRTLHDRHLSASGAMIAVTGANQLRAGENGR